MLQNVKTIQPNPIMKQIPSARCPQQKGRNEKGQEHHATLSISMRTSTHVVAPHWEPLTLPCISSRMVRVTFRPPSETFDSISYQGMGDAR